MLHQDKPIEGNKSLLYLNTLHFGPSRSNYYVPLFYVLFFIEVRYDVLFFVSNFLTTNHLEGRNWSLFHLDTKI